MHNSNSNITLNEIVVVIVQHSCCDLFKTILKSTNKNFTIHTYLNSSGKSFFRNPQKKKTRHRELLPLSTINYGVVDFLFGGEERSEGGWQTLCVKYVLKIFRKQLKS